MLSKTIQNISSSSSSSMSSPSTSKKSSNSSSAYSTSTIYPSGQIKSINANVTSKPIGSCLANEKWTCMVCLSKHSAMQEICTICGSSKSNASCLQATQSSHAMLANSLLAAKNSNSLLNAQSTAKSPATSPSNNLFSSYLMNELGIKHKLGHSYKARSREHDAGFDQPMDTSTAFRNPYIKKWTCIKCNYSNDSLKIVCLNCRWIKTSPNTTSSVLASTSGEAEQSSDAKRAKPNGDLLVETASCQSSICASCKSPIVSETKEKPQPNLVVDKPEPTKAPSIFAAHKTQPKWTCDTCLVSNADTCDKCACCMTPKPNSVVPVSKPVEPVASIFQAKPTEQNWTCDTCLVSNAESSDKCACCMAAKPSSKPPKSTGLFANVSTSAKWSCGTCLVNNDADKLKCVCCQTDKPGTESVASKAPLLIPTGASILKPVDQTLNSSIKFGSSGVTTAPINFGSSSSILQEKLGAGVSEVAPFKFGLSTPTVTPAEAQSIAKPSEPAPTFSFKPLTTDSISNKPTFSFGGFGSTTDKPGN